MARCDYVGGRSSAEYRLQSLCLSKRKSLLNLHLVYNRKRNPSNNHCQVYSSNDAVALSILDSETETETQMCEVRMSFGRSRQMHYACGGLMVQNQIYRRLLPPYQTLVPTEWNCVDVPNVRLAHICRPVGSNLHTLWVNPLTKLYWLSSDRRASVCCWWINGIGLQRPRSVCNWVTRTLQTSEVLGPSPARLGHWTFHIWVDNVTTTTFLFQLRVHLLFTVNIEFAGLWCFKSLNLVDWRIELHFNPVKLLWISLARSCVESLVHKAGVTGIHFHGSSGLPEQLKEWFPSEFTSFQSS